VSGEGIKMGIFGQEIKALIDLRRAEPGELTADCMGPQKSAFCEFFDHKDGTLTLFVKPQEPGKHVLQIKYNDKHVPGSAFEINIDGGNKLANVDVSSGKEANVDLSKIDPRLNFISTTVTQEELSKKLSRSPIQTHASKVDQSTTTVVFSPTASSKNVPRLDAKSGSVNSGSSHASSESSIFRGVSKEFMVQKYTFKRREIFNFLYT
jgi:hypothetical protein